MKNVGKRFIFETELNGSRRLFGFTHCHSSYEQLRNSRVNLVRRIVTRTYTL